MNNDLISREALNKIIDKITWYHINPYGELVDGALWNGEALYKAEDIYNAIDNAPTVDIPTELCKGCRFLKDCETCEEKLRPQGEWIIVDRLSNGELKIRCNNCKADFRRRFLPNFCEFCGADMQEGGAV